MQRRAARAGAEWASMDQGEFGEDVESGALIIMCIWEAIGTATWHLPSLSMQLGSPKVPKHPVMTRHLRQRSVPRGRPSDYANSEGAVALIRGGGIDAASGGRPRVAEGRSPNWARYAVANRPSSQKPYEVAICVTVVVAGSPRTSARRARCNCRSLR